MREVIEQLKIENQWLRKKVLAPGDRTYEGKRRFCSKCAKEYADQEY